MKTDNITNLVFSEIDIKESNLNKNNFTIYSLDILSEETDNLDSDKYNTSDSSTENSIDLNNYNLDIKSNSYSDIHNLNNNTLHIHDTLNTDETFNTKLFFNNFINSNNKYLTESNKIKKNIILKIIIKHINNF